MRIKTTKHLISYMLRHIKSNNLSLVMLYNFSIKTHSDGYTVHIGYIPDSTTGLQVYLDHVRRKQWI